MSYSRQVTIMCDTCGAWDQVHRGTASSLRQLLKREGWKRVKLAGATYDMCPACAAKGKKDDQP